MINIINKKDCCGCNACGDICPKNAIKFVIDIEGFWYPEIDEELCVDCGLCEKTCPIINIDKLKNNDLKQSLCYAAEHKNLEVVFDSTSGGMFSALADIMYQSQGFVGGAIFNDDFSVKHYISSHKIDLPKLRSSKYLQSNLENFYIKVRDLCAKGEKVLICGCPCQMAAIRAFLNQNFENLLIVDFICLGINSPKVWHKYLQSFEQRYGYPVIYAKAKSKEYGWRNLTQKVTLSNGKTYYETKDISLYTKGYIKTHAYARPSCYDCKFKGLPRIADITLADYWGVEKNNISFDKDLGTSLVMLNSSKSVAFFEKMKHRINYIEIPFESIFSGNKALLEPLSLPEFNRADFFSYLDTHSFSEVADKYFVDKDHFKRKIKSAYFIIKRIAKHTVFNPFKLVHFLYINKLMSCSLTQIFQGNCIFAQNKVIMEINPKASVKITGFFTLGEKRVKKSKLESRLLVEKDASLITEGNVTVQYGADIEVFSGGTLIFKGGNATNLNTTIICADNIIIGKNVMIGRNVTIRDNNGNHYLNRAGYKNTRPVIIGDKVWLCEGCTIMPGVKIGDGAIIGGGAFVTNNVPANCLVIGNPATIVDENVLWKY